MRINYLKMAPNFLHSKLDCDNIIFGYNFSVFLKKINQDRKLDLHAEVLGLHPIMLPKKQPFSIENIQPVGCLYSSSLVRQPFFRSLFKKSQKCLLYALSFSLISQKELKKETAQRVSPFFKYPTNYFFLSSRKSNMICYIHKERPSKKWQLLTQGSHLSVYSKSLFGSFSKEKEKQRVKYKQQRKRKFIVRSVITQNRKLLSEYYTIFHYVEKNRALGHEKKKPRSRCLALDQNKTLNRVQRNFNISGREVEKKFFSRNFDKNRLKKFVIWFNYKWGLTKTLQLLETLKFLGFKYAQLSGLSLNIEDLYIPNEKKFLVDANDFSLLEQEFKTFQKINEQTNYSVKFISTWTFLNQLLRNAFLQYFKTGINPLNHSFKTPFNGTTNKQETKNYTGSDSLYIMAFSGARGNMSQVSQLTLMRGLMSDPLGNLVEFPIISNFKEGLNLTEYLISCYGARKGIIDTGLRTATAGDFTRRLVDVAHSVIIRSYDCFTKNGIYLNDLVLFQSQKTLLSLEQRLIGRIISNNSRISQNYRNKEIPSSSFFSTKLYSRNLEISRTKFGNSKLQQNRNKTNKQEDFSTHTKIQLNQINTKNKFFKPYEISTTTAEKEQRAIEKQNFKIHEEILVRSPLTCEARSTSFLCRKCYGWNAIGKIVDLGEAVGVIAAQSLGEPGTQLTLRTFHTGGVYSESAAEFKLLVPFDGNLIIPNYCSIKRYFNIKEKISTFVAWNRKSLHPSRSQFNFFANQGKDVLELTQTHINTYLTDQSNQKLSNSLEKKKRGIEKFPITCNCSSSFFRHLSLFSPSEGYKNEAFKPVPLSIPISSRVLSSEERENKKREKSNSFYKIERSEEKKITTNYNLYKSGLLTNKENHKNFERGIKRYDYLLYRPTFEIIAIDNRYTSDLFSAFPYSAFPSNFSLISGLEQTRDYQRIGGTVQQPFSSMTLFGQNQNKAYPLVVSDDNSYHLEKKNETEYLRKSIIESVFKNFPPQKFFIKFLQTSPFLKNDNIFSSFSKTHFPEIFFPPEIAFLIKSTRPFTENGELISRSHIESELTPIFASEQNKIINKKKAVSRSASQSERSALSGTKKEMGKEAFAPSEQELEKKNFLISYKKKTTSLTKNSDLNKLLNKNPYLPEDTLNFFISRSSEGAKASFSSTTLPILLSLQALLRNNREKVVESEMKNSKREINEELQNEKQKASSEIWEVSLNNSSFPLKSKFMFHDFNPNKDNFLTLNPIQNNNVSLMFFEFILIFSHYFISYFYDISSQLYITNLKILNPYVGRYSFKTALTPLRSKDFQKIIKPKKFYQNNISNAIFFDNFCNIEEKINRNQRYLNYDKQNNIQTRKLNKIVFQEIKKIAYYQNFLISNSLIQAISKEKYENQIHESLNQPPKQRKGRAIGAFLFPNISKQNLPNFNSNINQKQVKNAFSINKQTFPFTNFHFDKKKTVFSAIDSQKLPSFNESHFFQKDNLYKRYREVEKKGISERNNKSFSIPSFRRNREKTGQLKRGSASRGIKFSFGDLEKLAYPNYRTTQVILLLKPEGNLKKNTTVVDIQEKTDGLLKKKKNYFFFTVPLKKGIFNQEIPTALPTTNFNSSFLNYKLMTFSLPQTVFNQNRKFLLNIFLLMDPIKKFNQTIANFREEIKAFSPVFDSQALIQNTRKHEKRSEEKFKINSITYPYYDTQMIFMKRSILKTRLPSFLSSSPFRKEEGKALSVPEKKPEKKDIGEINETIQLRSLEDKKKKQKINFKKIEIFNSLLIRKSSFWLFLSFVKCNYEKIFNLFSLINFSLNSPLDKESVFDKFFGERGINSMLFFEKKKRKIKEFSMTNFFFSFVYSYLKKKWKRRKKNINTYFFLTGRYNDVRPTISFLPLYSLSKKNKKWKKQGINNLKPVTVDQKKILFTDPAIKDNFKSDFHPTPLFAPLVVFSVPRFVNDLSIIDRLQNREVKKEHYVKGAFFRNMLVTSGKRQNKILWYSLISAGSKQFYYTSFFNFSFRKIWMDKNHSREKKHGLSSQNVELRNEILNIAEQDRRQVALFSSFSLWNQFTMNKKMKPSFYYSITDPAIAVHFNELTCQDFYWKQFNINNISRKSIENQKLNFLKLARKKNLFDLDFYFSIFSSSVISPFKNIWKKKEQNRIRISRFEIVSEDREKKKFFKNRILNKRQHALYLNFEYPFKHQFNELNSDFLGTASQTNTTMTSKEKRTTKKIANIKFMTPRIISHSSFFSEYRKKLEGTIKRKQTNLKSSKHTIIFNDDLINQINFSHITNRQGLLVPFHLRSKKYFISINHQNRSTINIEWNWKLNSLLWKRKIFNSLCCKFFLIFSSDFHLPPGSAFLMQNRELINYRATARIYPISLISTIMKKISVTKKASKTDRVAKKERAFGTEIQLRKKHKGLLKEAEPKKFFKRQNKRLGNYFPSFFFSYFRHFYFFQQNSRSYDNTLQSYSLIFSNPVVPTLSNSEALSVHYSIPFLQHLQLWKKHPLRMFFSQSEQRELSKKKELDKTEKRKKKPRAEWGIKNVSKNILKLFNSPIKKKYILNYSTYGCFVKKKKLNCTEIFSIIPLVVHDKQVLNKNFPFLSIVNKQLQFSSLMSFLNKKKNPINFFNSSLFDRLPTSSLFFLSKLSTELFFERKENTERENTKERLEEKNRVIKKKKTQTNDLSNSLPYSLKDRVAQKSAFQTKKRNAKNRDKHSYKVGAFSKNHLKVIQKTDSKKNLFFFQSHNLKISKLPKYNYLSSPFIINSSIFFGKYLQMTDSISWLSKTSETRWLKAETYLLKAGFAFHLFLQKYGHNNHSDRNAKTFVNCPISPISLSDTERVSGVKREIGKKKLHEVYKKKKNFYSNYHFGISFDRTVRVGISY